MKIEITVDNNNYLNGYTVIDDNTQGSITGAILVDIDETEESLRYVYDSYKIIDGVAHFDKDKLNNVVNQEPPKTKEQELEERIKQLESIIEKLGL